MNQPIWVNDRERVSVIWVGIFYVSEVNAHPPFATYFFTINIFEIHSKYWTSLMKPAFNDFLISLWISLTSCVTNFLNICLISLAASLILSRWHTTLMLIPSILDCFHAKTSKFSLSNSTSSPRHSSVNSVLILKDHPGSSTLMVTSFTSFITSRSLASSYSISSHPLRSCRFFPIAFG